MRTATVQPRWVCKDRRIHDFSSCKLCGTCSGICTGEPAACRVTTCLACGSPQCMSNGLARGQCGICLVGLLPDWSGSECRCSYKGCGAPAVARVDGRNKNRCRTHLERGKWTGYVAQRLTERDKGFALTEVCEVPILGES